MTIDQKLSELEIKRILVVDDRIENILAVQSAFAKYDVVSIDYAASAKSAIEMIKAASEKGQKYDLVISDLEMETKTAGLDVVKEALMKSAYATIATGRNYDKSKHESHGASTTVLPPRKSLPGKKDEQEVWDFVLEKSLDYITSFKDSWESTALQRCLQYDRKIPDSLVDMLLQKYG